MGVSWLAGYLPVLVVVAVVSNSGFQGRVNRRKDSNLKSEEVLHIFYSTVYAEYLLIVMNMRDESCSHLR